MGFDPEMYMLRIRKETNGGEIQFVGRVEEFPEISVYEETSGDAYDALLAILEHVNTLYKRNNKSLPQPTEIKEEYSGRMTLRLTKSNHKGVAELSGKEGVSINQLISQFVTVGLTNNAVENQVNEVLQPIARRFQAGLRKEEIMRAKRAEMNYNYSKNEEVRPRFNVINGGKR